MTHLSCEGLEKSFRHKKVVDSAHVEVRGGEVVGLLGPRDGRDGSITIHQDVSLYAARLGSAATARHEIAAGRSAWIQVARGAATVNGVALGQGDGAALTGEPLVEAAAGPDGAELILFDLR